MLWKTKDDSVRASDTNVGDDGTLTADGEISRMYSSYTQIYEVALRSLNSQALVLEFELVRFEDNDAKEERSQMGPKLPLKHNC